LSFSSFVVGFSVVHLQDLAVLEEQQADFVGAHDRLINWEKRELMWEIVKEILEPQVVPYSLYKVQQVCDLILKLNRVDNSAPRNGSQLDVFYSYGR
jgi:hypothetical protein